MKKEDCEKKNQWSELGVILSGHKYVEEDASKYEVQILKCEDCGEVSIGWKPPAPK